MVPCVPLWRGRNACGPPRRAMYTLTWRGCSWSLHRPREGVQLSSQRWGEEDQILSKGNRKCYRDKLHFPLSVTLRKGCGSAETPTPVGLGAHLGPGTGDGGAPVSHVV